MLYAAQLRAARALLGWNQHDLANRAGVGIATVKRLELEEGSLVTHKATEKVIRSAFEAAGVEILDATKQHGIGAVMSVKK